MPFADNNATEMVPCSLHHIRGCVMVTRLITGDVHFDYLLNVISARFLHCKVIILSFAANKYLMERHSEALQLSPFSLCCRFNIH